jgi:hypothetical protein
MDPIKKIRRRHSEISQNGYHLINNECSLLRKDITAENAKGRRQEIIIDFSACSAIPAVKINAFHGFGVLRRNMMDCAQQQCPPVIGQTYGF